MIVMECVIRFQTSRSRSRRNGRRRRKEGRQTDRLGCNIHSVEHVLLLIIPQLLTFGSSWAA
jgi:hypothetical protein